MNLFYIIGMGRTGRHLASKMQELGNDVMIVDKNPAIIEALSGRFTDSNICDCTNDAIIKALGVDNFDICFVTIGEDFQASLVVTSLLKQFGARMIVSKAKQDIQADLLRQDRCRRDRLSGARDLRKARPCATTQTTSLISSR